MSMICEILGGTPVASIPGLKRETLVNQFAGGHFSLNLPHLALLEMPAT
jgi:hypothetical protein